MTSLADLGRFVKALTVQIQYVEFLFTLQAFSGEWGTYHSGGASQGLVHHLSLSKGSDMLIAIVICTMGVVQEVALPIDKAVVHRAVEPGGQGVFARLAREVVVVGMVPQENRGLATNYALGAAPEPSELEFPRFKQGSSVFALTVGPLLDGPDTVTVKKCLQNGEEIELYVEHTQMRLEGAQFLRNITSRPMVQVPLALVPGTYRLTVTWKAIPGLPSGKPIQLDPITHVCKFTVIP